MHLLADLQTLLDITGTWHIIVEPSLTHDFISLLMKALGEK